VAVVSVVRAAWDRVAGYALIAAGLACLVAGYFGVAGSPYIAEELTFVISGGIGGLLLLGAGGTMLLTADLHDEWRKLDRIEAALESSTVAAPPRLPGVVARAVGLAAAGFGAGAVVVIVAWNRAGGVADPKPALEDLTLGLVGLMIAGAGSVAATLWLKRVVKLRQSRLLAPWEVAEMLRRAGVETTANGAALPGTDDFLVAAGLSRYHRQGCAAVQGLPTRAVTAERVPAELKPCDLCEAGALV
jgi:hypothetical protein